jgi:hypothetical protein
MEVAMSAARTIGETRLVDFVESIQSASRILGEATAIVVALDGPKGEKFQFELPVVTLDTGPITVEGVVTRVSATAVFATRFRHINDLTLVQDVLIVQMRNKARQLVEICSTLKTAIVHLHADASITGIDDGGRIWRNNRGIALDLARFFLDIYNLQQEILGYCRVVADGSNLGMADVGEIVSGLENARTEQSRAEQAVRDARRTIMKMMEDIRQRTAKLDSFVETGISLLKGLEDAKAKTDDDRRQIEIIRSEVSEISEKAKVLLETVRNYGGAFQTFQDELAARENRFAEGTERYNSLLQRAETTSEELDRLKMRAEKVLGQSTVAGLAETFGGEVKSIDRKMWLAGIIGLLGVLVLSVTVKYYILDGSLVTLAFRPSETASGWAHASFLLTMFATRLVAMLPSLCILAFGIKWYAELFTLRREYSEKFSVAASLPGFKTEAGEGGEAVVVMAYMRILGLDRRASDANKHRSETGWHPGTNIIEFAKGLLPGVAKIDGKD